MPYNNSFQRTGRAGSIQQKSIPDKTEVKDIPISTLVNKNQKPGHYSVQWDASQYSSGVYFYRIQAGGFQQVKKCLLIK